MRMTTLGVLSIFLLTGCATAVSSDPVPEAEKLAFDRFSVTLGSGQRQTLLTGFFLDEDYADLAVLQTMPDGEKRLLVYSNNGENWVPGQEFGLRSNIQFVDVAASGDRDLLLLFSKGEIVSFDPQTGVEKPLVNFAAEYNPGKSGLHYAGFEPKGPIDEGEIPHVDISRDLNGDDRDDLILPDVDGFWISMQGKQGSFSPPAKFGPAEPFQDEYAFGDKRKYGEVGITPLTLPWYLTRVHVFDYNMDSLPDLAFWNVDHFEVHLQDLAGSFNREPERVPVGALFDADGIYSLIFGMEDESTFSLLTGLRKKTGRTVLKTIMDVNGDGAADLILQSLEGRSILRLRSRYIVYFGEATDNGTKFLSEPSSIMLPRGKAGGIEAGGYSSMWLEDFDGDGQVDILRGDIKISLSAMLRAMLGTSITLQAELFHLDDGSYPDKATTRIKIKSDIDIHGDGRDGGFFPSVLVGDVNGDQCSDVLVGKSREQLLIYLGGPELLAGKPQELAITLPGDERNSWLTDLNRDGKQDLLMHFPSATAPHQVTLLIAQ